MRLAALFCQVLAQWALSMSSACSSSAKIPEPSIIGHSRSFRHQSMYSETFAGLVQAALDAGVPGEIIEELEAAGICSNESARSALREGKCSDLLSAHLRAITLIAFGHLAGVSVVLRASQNGQPVPGPAARRSGSLHKAVESAAPQNRQITLAKFRQDIWARSNTASRDSRWATWCKICAAWQIPPVPLTVDTVHMVASSFKAAGYRSARQYFSRARREHILRTHVAVPADVELAITDAFRSVERGIGGPALKDAFRAEEITLSFDTSDDRAAAALVVLGLWFLMREIEIASLLCKHFQLDEAKGAITMTLWASKTDSVGCLVSRTHKCYCSVVPKHICPFHVALLFAKDKPSEGDILLFPASAGGVLTKQETIDIIRSVLQKSEVPLTLLGRSLSAASMVTA